MRDLDIAHGRERRKQVELLKHEADAVFPQPGALGVVECGKIHAVNDHPPAGRPREPAQQIKKRGLARTRRSHNGHKLPALHGKRNPAHRGNRKSAGGINFRQILGENDRRSVLWLHISIVNATPAPLLP